MKDPNVEIADMATRGLNILEAIKSIRHTYNLSLKDAKWLVTSHKSYADQAERITAGEYSDEENQELHFV